MSLSTLKLALKVLLRRKVFTAISLFGIVATLLVLVVAAAILDSGLAAAPPESRSARMLVVDSVRGRGDQLMRTSPPGPAFLERTVRGLPGVEEVSLIRHFDWEDAWVGTRKVSSSMKGTDGAFWRVHDFSFVEGGPYDEADDAAGSAVAVISERQRDRFYGEGPALGRTFVVGEREFRVVGVVESVSSLRFVSSADVWMPLGSQPSDYGDGIFGDLTAVLLARPGASLDAIRNEFEHRVAQVPLPDSRLTTLTSSAETHVELIARDFLPRSESGTSPATRLAFLFGALALAFMSLPALNLVNLNLSRVLERATEIGVRKAFGATRARIVGQLVLENVLLALIGGAITLALAPFVLASIDASDFFEGSRLALNLRVLAWGLLFAVVLGVLSGAWPAWRMSRLPPVEVLRGRLS